METKFDFPKTPDRLVYVKSVDVTDLPPDVQDQAGPLTQLYAVHDSDGAQLALVTDRSLAFVLARQNDLEPVTVH